MKIRREVAVAVMALTMMIAICAAARSARQQSSDERTQSTPKTAPEMDRLKFYLGEWDTPRPIRSPRPIRKAAKILVSIRANSVLVETPW